MPRRRLLAVCALAIVPVFAACGDDGGDDSDNGSTPGTTETAGQSVTAAVSSASPEVDGPASKYTITLDDIGISWFTDVKNVLVIDEQSYADTRDVFETAAEGHRLLKEWGFTDGYQTAYIPEGRDESVLTGSYYIVMETYRFETAEGAAKAYQYYRDSITSGGAPPVKSAPIGNQSVGFTAIGAKIPKTTVNAQFEQIIFQRGNVVSIVLTTGAQGFMKHEHAWKLAAMADEKILGVRSAIEPTPTSNYQTPTPAAKP